MDPLRPDQVIRSRRKTVSLVVTKDARLIVRAPNRTPQAFIDRVIAEKSGWILRKMEEMRSRPKLPARSYVDGDVFLYLGKQYSVEVIEGTVADIALADKLYITRQALPDIRSRLHAWYTEKAHRIISTRIAWFAIRTGCDPKRVRITNATRRWGSCSSSGTVSFSWRLVMAPPEVIDYVVVHELVHIGQPDHSPAFWEKVERVMPDYCTWKEWLATNEQMLEI